MLYKIETTKQHTVYRNKNGEVLPGTTTVLGILAKPALYQWYFKMGASGDDPFKKKDNAADIGTIGHALLMCRLRGWELDTSNLIPENVSIAKNCVNSYLEWEKGQTLKPILTEEELIDENIGYGGTIDLYADIDGEKVLVDFKTSSGIYKDMFLQLAGYRNLLEVNGHKVDRAMILNIGKANNSDFGTKSFTDLTKEFEIFKHCLAIYKLQREK